MREVARAVKKPESTVYRWRLDNPELFQAAKEYAERKHDEANKAKG